MTELLDFAWRFAQDSGAGSAGLAILVRVTALLAAVMPLAVTLRRASAALRNLVWTLSLAGVLLIPLFSWSFPAWQWAILPPRQTPAPLPLTTRVVEEPAVETQPPAGDSADAAVNEPFGQRTMPAAPSDGPVSESASLDVAQDSSGAAAPVLAEPGSIASPKWSLPAILAGLWAAGTSLGCVWLIVGVLGAWHIARHAEGADSHWTAVLRQVLDQCGYRRAVEVRQCRHVWVPMTWGLRRPVILVPLGSTAWPEGAKRAVLLHELGHIRRSDCVWHLLGRLACAVYWFHPLVWLAARQLRKTSEQAADDVVLGTNMAPPDYAEHLVAIAAGVRGLRWFGSVALPMASPSDLEGRVLAILDPRRNHRRLKRRTCYVFLLLAAVFLVPCAVLRLGYAHAEDKQSQATATATAQDSELSKSSGKGASQMQSPSGTSDPAFSAESRKSGSSGHSLPSLAQVVEEVRRNEALLRDLDSTTRKTWRFLPPDAKRAPTAAGFGSTGSPQTKAIEEINRTVTVGDKLRFSGEETVSLLSGKKIQVNRLAVFDGSQTVAIEEGNSATVYPRRYEPAQLYPPLCWGIFTLEVNFPLSVYLQGTEAMKLNPKVRRYPREAGGNYEFYKAEAEVVGQETVEGLDCVKVRVRRWYYTSSPPALQDLWLAKDRNYHVARCRTSYLERGAEVPYDGTRVTKWLEIGKGVWLPQVVEWHDLRPAASRLGWARRLTVEKAIWKPKVPNKFFALPPIPASLPKYVVGKDGRLIDSPHHPVPIQAAEGTTLASILKRLAAEEEKYDQLEVLTTSTYQNLNPHELGGGLYLRIEAHERSVILGDRLYHEEERKTKPIDGAATTTMTRQAYDGRWRKEEYRYVNGQGKPRVTATIGLDRKNEVRVVRAHTILFDSPRNHSSLAAFLSSGWADRNQGLRLRVEYVGDDRIDNLHCYRLKCTEGQKGGDAWVQRIFLWLARDRNLLPVRLEWYDPQWSSKLPGGIAFVGELREIRPGQWFPLRTIELAHREVGVDGLCEDRPLLQWRRDLQVDKLTLAPRVDARLFSDLEASEGTQVNVRDQYGQFLGKFKQPRTGNLEISEDKLRAMQHARETNEEDNYSPQDPATPQRKQRIDAALKVLRAVPRPTQRDRIAAALVILRNYLVFQTNTSKWALAIRELITVGKPAVPTLIEELDRTAPRGQGSVELRALGFVLRGIGDPRAVPALIRALPYTLQRPSSDCALSVLDRGLLRFMQQHDNAQTDYGNNFLLGRAINEILPALQKLTGIKQVVPGGQGDQEYEKVYHTYLGGKANDNLAHRRLFLAFAERWADWWAKNWKSYLKNEADAQLEQTRSALERISKALTPELPKRNQSSVAPYDDAAWTKLGGQTVGPLKAVPRDRGPNVVSGCVTDAQGRPMEGVAVRAYCGVGTLFEAGITQTDKDGRYILRFGGHGWGDLGANAIIARKAGFAQKSPSQGGYSYGAVINFVMVPAPTVDVEILDADSYPIVKKEVCLMVERRPPEGDVFDAHITDSMGQARFRDFPPMFACWITLGSAPRQEARTPSMTFAQPENYRVQLRLRRDTLTGKEHLDVLSVKNNKGEDVRSRVMVERASARTAQPLALPTISGTVVDEAGKAVGGASVILREQPTGFSSHHWQPVRTRNLARTATDATGRFTFANVSSPAPEGLRKEAFPLDVIVTAKGYGLAWKHMPAASPVDLTLDPEKTVRGQVVDSASKPVAKAKVRVIRFTGLDQLACPDESTHELPDVNAPNFLDLRWSDVPAAVETDAEGRFVLGDLPKDIRVTLLVDHPRFRPLEVFAATTTIPQPNLAYLHDEPVHTGDFRVVLKPGVRLHLRVVYEDTGEPAAHAGVAVQGIVLPPRDFTDQQGQFVRGQLRPGQCRIVVEPPAKSDYLSISESIELDAKQPDAKHTVKLPRGVIVTGRVVDASTGHGIAGAEIAHLPSRVPHGERLRTSAIRTKSQADGSFRLAVPAGKAELVVFGDVPGYLTRQRSGSLGNTDRRFRRAIDAVAGKALGEVVFRLTPVAVYAGTVVGPDGRPVPNTHIWTSEPLGNGTYRQHDWTTDSQGRFSLGSLFTEINAPKHQCELIFLNREKGLAGHQIVSSPEKREGQIPLTVTLQPTASVRGRVVGSGGRPAVGAVVRALRIEPRVNDRRPFQDGKTVTVTYESRRFIQDPDASVVTGAQGRYTVTNLIPGVRYYVWAETEGYAPHDRRHVDANCEFAAVAGQVHELADIQLEPITAHR